MPPENTNPDSSTVSEESDSKQNFPIEQKKTSLGPVVAISIIVIVLLLGALYYGTSRLSGPTSHTDMTAQEIQQMDDPIRNNLEAQSDSDDISSIEADLNASSYNNLDAEVSNVEKEL